MRTSKESWEFIHAIISGIFGFLASAIGAACFRLEESYLRIFVGIGIYLLANQLMIKFQFNSYALNGATITAVLNLLAQSLCTALWNVIRGKNIYLKWFGGVVLILCGVFLLQKEDSFREIQKNKSSQKKYS